jgi:assimilatory nitrate reductase catalytic subunit
VVVDPRRSATAEQADLHIQPVPGTDLAVALGLLHLAGAMGLVDEEYVAARTTGWPDVVRSVAGWPPDRVELVSGVPARQLTRLAQALGGPPASMLLTGRGPEQQSKGVDTVSALIGLMLALGRIGRPASGYGCLTGQANGQGGREHGQKADQLPGYRSISEPGDRSAVASVWGVAPEVLPGPGMSAVEMLGTIGRPGGVRGLIVAGSDLAVAGPDAGKVRHRLSALDLLAVLDSFPTETSQRAHFVLPVTQWAEEDGTVTNLEGRVLRRRAAVPAPAGVRTDLEVLCDLAARLGAGDAFRFAGAEGVFDELARASAGGRADYAGIAYPRLGAGPGLFWPCPDERHPGEPRMFTERFGHADGRARFVPVEYRDAGESPDEEFPLYFTTGRYREHYNSGGQTRRVARLQAARPEPRLQMHPSLAQRIGVEDGARVIVESRRGEARFRASIDTGIRADTVFAPFHWGADQCANLVTADTLDPVSRMPEFKVCAARVRAP